MAFTDDLIDERDDLWNEMLSHDFLNEIRNGELAGDTFNTWLKQDYEFVRAALPFVSAIKPKAPEAHVQGLSEAEMALHAELDLFEERAETLGVSVEDVQRNLTTQSYIQHLLSTAYREDYPVGLTVYWTAERAYHESWKRVEPELDETHDWYPFVDNWAGEEFGEFVNLLETWLNDTVSNVSAIQKERMREQFTWTVRYEIAFWDMAYGQTGNEWVRTDI